MENIVNLFYNSGLQYKMDFQGIRHSEERRDEAIHKYAPMQIKAESRLPNGAAQPIGNKVSGQNFDASQAPGIRINTIEIELWIKEIIDFPIAQK